ncbi:TetR/AcrR family transcriptional regulator [Nocardiopsis sp. CNT312]|uniref:TetR/AcrR family transcriptional regulator n=1 Tax=Nocardiopsis sp. CNT312 TaxID=1137268 RepID=UPI00048EF624|nr:TetR/AcrR family transcriptional regulator [Nocardiopsis sp. CNT312]
MPNPSTARGARGRTARISRGEIITAARRIMSEEGMARLTMRRLAREVDSTPMALYHHVRDKEELLLLLLEDHAERSLHRPAPLPDHPRDRVVVAASVLHDVLSTHPWIAEVLSADDLTSTSALWFVEQIVDGLAESGLTPEHAVHGYRAIWYYTVGEVMVQAARRRSDGGRTFHGGRGFSGLDPGELPRLAQVADRWPDLTAQDTYLDGLRALVDGLLTGQGRARPAR